MFSISGGKVFVGVVVKGDRESELAAYLYGGVKETQVFPTYMADTKLHMLEADTERTAQTQADRLSSGLFGARVCDAAGAIAMVQEFAPDPE